MGVCDYTDFIIRNGQDLPYFELLKEGYDDKQDFLNDKEPKYAGFSRAILVFIPNTMTKIQIENMQLDKFGKFDKQLINYENNCLEFGGFPDYSDALLNDGRIWTSKYKPGYWIINFVPDIYKIFITNEISPERLPLDIYSEILYNRDIDMRKRFPSLNKIEMYNFIIGNKNEEKLQRKERVTSDSEQLTVRERVTSDSEQSNDSENMDDDSMKFTDFISRETPFIYSSPDSKNDKAEFLLSSMRNRLPFKNIETDVILIRIPKKYSLDHISKLSPKELQKFEMTNVQYEDEFQEFILPPIISTRYPFIIEMPSQPDYWHVTLSRKFFKIFVTQEEKYEELSLFNYNDIFSGNNLNMVISFPSLNKKGMFEMIVNRGLILDSRPSFCDLNPAKELLSRSLQMIEMADKIYTNFTQTTLSIDCSSKNIKSSINITNKINKRRLEAAYGKMDQDDMDENLVYPIPNGYLLIFQSKTPKNKQILTNIYIDPYILDNFPKIINRYISCIYPECTKDRIRETLFCESHREHNTPQDISIYEERKPIGTKSTIERMILDRLNEINALSSLQELEKRFIRMKNELPIKFTITPYDRIYLTRV